jgi:hypothetical protein
MAAGNHGDGLGHFVAEILPPSEQKQRTHGHRQVILTVISLHESIEHGFFVVGIGNVPSGGLEGSLHVFLRAHNHEVHHVALILELVVDPARQAVEALDQVGVESSIRHFQGSDGHRGVGSRSVS